MNLLLDVGFNREVGGEAALYWNKEEGNLKELIEKADEMDAMQRSEYGLKAKKRIKSTFCWEYIGEDYKKVWN